MCPHFFVSSSSTRLTCQHVPTGDGTVRPANFRGLCFFPFFPFPMGFILFSLCLRANSGQLPQINAVLFYPTSEERGQEKLGSGQSEVVLTRQQWSGL